MWYKQNNKIQSLQGVSLYLNELPSIKKKDSKKHTLLLAVGHLQFIAYHYSYLSKLL